MSKRRTIEEEINAFIEMWGCDQITAFFRDIVPLLELFNVDDQDDWVMEEVGQEDTQTVRLIRTVYLMSRIVDFHTPKFCSLKIEFKDLWKRMEKHGFTESQD